MECWTARRFELALDIGEKGKGVSPVAPVRLAVTRLARLASGYRGMGSRAGWLEAESGMFMMMVKWCARDALSATSPPLLAIRAHAHLLSSPMLRISRKLVLRIAGQSRWGSRNKGTALNFPLATKLLHTRADQPPERDVANGGCRSIWSPCAIASPKLLRAQDPVDGQSR